MSLQNLTLNISLNIKIGEDGNATVSLTSDDYKTVTPAQPVIKGSTPKRKTADVQPTPRPADVQPTPKPATIVTPEEQESVQETLTKAMEMADTVAPVTAPTAPVPPPAPVPPIMNTPTQAEIDAAHEAQKNWTPRPPESDIVTPAAPPPLGATQPAQPYMPTPMSPPPVAPVDGAQATRDENIRVTAAAIFGQG